MILTGKGMKLGEINEILSRATKENPSSPVKHNHLKHLRLCRYGHEDAK